MREFVGRFGETIHRPQPLYFYFPHLLHKFAPWSVLMIALALIDLRSRNWRLRGVFREMSPETFWLLCWSIGGLIVMSLIPSKRVDRIFPVIPPLCLLLAAQISGIVDACAAPKAFGSRRSAPTLPLDPGSACVSPSSSPAATRVGRSSPAIAIIAMRWPSSEEMCDAKRKRITGVTRLYLPKMKGCFSIFERRTSLSRLMPSQNGTPEIWTRSLLQKKKRRLLCATFKVLLLLNCNQMSKNNTSRAGDTF